jgi:hypothetical protein
MSAEGGSRGTGVGMTWQGLWRHHAWRHKTAIGSLIPLPFFSVVSFLPLSLGFSPPRTQSFKLAISTLETQIFSIHLLKQGNLTPPINF